MLRFPLNRRVILLTASGVITCTIVKANNNFLFCQDVEYQGLNLGKVYVDRSSVVAYGDLTEESSPKKLEKLEEKIQQAKIFYFTSKKEELASHV